MKHPSEWRYSDEAFHEVKARIGGNSWADSKTHQVFEDQGAGVYRNMGWFQLTYFPYGGGVLADPRCQILWPERSAEIHRGDEKLATMERFDSVRQLVEWCKMVGAIINETPK